MTLVEVRASSPAQSVMLSLGAVRLSSPVQSVILSLMEARASSPVQRLARRRRLQLRQTPAPKGRNRIAGTEVPRTTGDAKRVPGTTPSQPRPIKRTA